jgi:hypothetical protein
MEVTYIAITRSDDFCVAILKVVAPALPSPFIEIPLRLGFNWEFQRLYRWTRMAISKSDG